MAKCSIKCEINFSTCFIYRCLKYIVTANLSFFAFHCFDNHKFGIIICGIPLHRYGKLDTYFGVLWGKATGLSPKVEEEWCTYCTARKVVSRQGLVWIGCLCFYDYLEKHHFMKLNSKTYKSLAFVRDHKGHASLKV